MSEEDPVSQFDQQFAALSAAAHDLGAASADLETILSRFEEKLASLGLEFEVWLESNPLARNELSVSPSNVSARTEDHLGYAPDPRPGRRNRCLCVRTAEIADRPLDDRSEVTRILAVRRLADATPKERFEALSRLGDLLDRMTERARRHLEVIRNARRLTDPAPPPAE